MIDKRTRRLILANYAEGKTSEQMASVFGISVESVMVVLMESGANLEDVDPEVSYRHRMGLMEEKVADTENRFVKMRLQRDRLNKRVYQLEAEFKRRGIPLP